MVEQKTVYGEGQEQEMKLILQCDSASCSASETVEIHLSKKQEETISSFLREHGQLHTVIST